MPNVVLTFECTKMNNKSSLRSVEKKYVNHNFHRMHLVVLVEMARGTYETLWRESHHHETSSWGGCTQHPMCSGPVVPGLGSQSSTLESMYP